MNNQNLTEEDMEKIRLGKLSSSEKEKLEKAILENEPLGDELALQLALRKKIQMDIEAEANEYAKKFEKNRPKSFPNKWRIGLMVAILIVIGLILTFIFIPSPNNSPNPGVELIQAMIAGDPTFSTLGDEDWRSVLKRENPDWDGAISLIEAEIPLKDPDCVDGARQFYLGAIYLKIKESPGQAIPYLECAYSLKIETDKTPLFLLESYLITDDIETARRFYDDNASLIDLDELSLEQLRQLDLN